MENKTQLLVKDFDFSEEELKIINTTMCFFLLPYQYKENVSAHSLAKVAEEMEKVLQIQWVKDNANDKIYSLLSKIKSYLTPYLIKKSTFEILGRTDNSLTSENYFLILASNLEEAKEIRDKIEAETYSKKDISIEKLLNIVNNMERSHGSSTISPETLKHLIKETLNK